MRAGVCLKLFLYIGVYRLLGAPREEGASPKSVYSA